MITLLLLLLLMIIIIIVIIIIIIIILILTSGWPSGVERVLVGPALLAGQTVQSLGRHNGYYSVAPQRVARKTDGKLTLLVNLGVS